MIDLLCTWIKSLWQKRSRPAPFIRSTAMILDGRFLYFRGALTHSVPCVWTSLSWYGDFSTNGHSSLSCGILLKTTRWGLWCWAGIFGRGRCVSVGLMTHEQLGMAAICCKCPISLNQEFALQLQEQAVSWRNSWRSRILVLFCGCVRNENRLSLSWSRRLRSIPKRKSHVWDRLTGNLRSYPYNTCVILCLNNHPCSFRSYFGQAAVGTIFSVRKPRDAVAGTASGLKTMARLRGSTVQRLSTKRWSAGVNNQISEAFFPTFSKQETGFILERSMKPAL